MTAQITPVQRKQTDNASYGQLGGAALGAIVGGYYGGGTGALQGAQMGSSVGGMAGNAVTANQQASNAPTTIPTTETASSPASRRMDAINSDPATQMREGKIALSSMDEQTRKAFEPVLDEGLKRAAQQRKQEYGYGYAGTQTA